MVFHRGLDFHRYISYSKRIMGNGWNSKTVCRVLLNLIFYHKNILNIVLFAVASGYRARHWPTWYSAFSVIHKTLSYSDTVSRSVLLVLYQISSGKVIIILSLCFSRAVSDRLPHLRRHHNETCFLIVLSVGACNVVQLLHIQNIFHRYSSAALQNFLPISRLYQCWLLTKLLIRRYPKNVGCWH